jgi:predicted nucleic-acid-binding protein
MKGLDTNVLVRYIVQDDAKQSRCATNFIEKECSIENPAFISGIVLCELVWVLETAYEYLREEIAPVLEKILRARQFHIHEPHVIWQALRGYKQKGADFADHYILSLNANHNCEHTATFDKKAARLIGFKLLEK